MAFDCAGNEIVVCEVQSVWWPGEVKLRFLVVEYTEALTNPVPTPGAGADLEAAPGAAPAVARQKFLDRRGLLSIRKTQGGAVDEQWKPAVGDYLVVLKDVRENIRSRLGDIVCMHFLGRLVESSGVCPLLRPSPPPHE